MTQQIMLVLSRICLWLLSVHFIFFYFWLRWVFVVACRLSLVAVSVGYSSLWCAGFSLWWLLLLLSRALGAWVSVVAARGLSSCSTQAQQLWLTGSRAQAQQLWHTDLVAPQHVGDLPRPGIEPLSPALEDGFLTTVPPGKSPCILKYLPEKKKIWEKNKKFSGGKKKKRPALRI